MPAHPPLRHVKIPLSPLLLLFSCLVLFSCSSKDEQSSIQEVEISEITPILESYIEKAMKEWKVPGAAVGIIQGDQLVYSKGFGTKETGKSQSIDAQTIFPIASLSKAFGAATLAVLVDKGLLDWYDEVVKYDRSFMLYVPWVTRNFQIIDLFAQHSGLASHVLTDLFELGFEPSHILKVLKNVRPVSSFRSTFTYQNVLQLELDPLCQVLLSKSWDVVAKENILDPLGMSHTYFKLNDFYRQENRIACHLLLDDQVQTIPLVPFIEATGPSGGIISCVEDLSKWIIMQLANGKFHEKQIISEENLKVTHTHQTEIDNSTFYALGWIISQKKSYEMIWHNGDIQGAHSVLAFIPEANLGIVILSNLSQTLMPEAVALRFFDLAFDRPEKDYSEEYLETKKAKNAEQEKDLQPPQDLSPALPLEDYVGKYSNDIYGTFEIAIKDEKLSLTLQQPHQLSAILNHWHRDIFLVEWEGFLRSIDFNKGSKIIFDEEPTGQMGGFRYYPSDYEHSLYYFERLPKQEDSSANLSDAEQKET
jgi:CubicO group peptidase (beta-lactamase class C family)